MCIVLVNSIVYLIKKVQATHHYYNHLHLIPLFSSYHPSVSFSSFTVFSKDPDMLLMFDFYCTSPKSGFLIFNPTHTGKELMKK
jgi:hypothetical protein